MELRILTYNLLFMKRKDILKDICRSYKPDILCFQEFELDHTQFVSIEKLGYTLAGYSFSFWKFLKLYGIVTFYNPKTIICNENESIDLNRSFYERVLNVLRFNKNQPRTILKTHFSLKKSKKEFVLYNFHLTPWSLSGHRAKQLEGVLEQIDSKSRVILLGDLNHPYRRRTIQSLLKKYALNEATFHLFYTYFSRWLSILPIKLKLDYIFYRQLTHIRTRRISNPRSDHYPILSDFSL